MVRIRRLRYTLEPLRMEEALHDPYRVKVLRKVNLVDVMVLYAFNIHSVFFLYFAFIGYRWLRFPCIRSLGEKGRGSESGCTIRKYAAH